MVEPKAWFEMSCKHCGSWNAQDEERCRRCGRRLKPSPNDSTNGYRVTAVAGNLAAMRAPERAPLPSLPPSAAVQPPRPPRQALLFPERPASNIIPISGSGAAAPMPATRPAVKRAPRNTDLQFKLDFLPPAPPAPRKLSTTVEAVIFCDAPVATPVHRLAAGVLDLSLIVIGYGLLLLAFHLGGGHIEPNRHNLGVFAAAFLVFAVFYGLVWVLARCESPGMRGARLRLINFDGFPPEPSQRVLRFLGVCLSFATGGLGLFWALVDEESLTWQDHISKTFPTFEEADSISLRRR